MKAEHISWQFNELLGPIIRILNSCQTSEQLRTGHTWAVNVIIGLRNHIQRISPQDEGAAAAEAQAALSELHQRYRISWSYDQIDGETVVRQVAPHLSICRSCGGSGVEAKTGTGICAACGGSGRVKVASIIHTMVKPFSPGHDDAALPLKM